MLSGDSKSVTSYTGLQKKRNRIFSVPAVVSLYIYIYKILSYRNIYIRVSYKEKYKSQPAYLLTSSIRSYKHIATPSREKKRNRNFSGFLTCGTLKTRLHENVTLRFFSVTSGSFGAEPCSVIHLQLSRHRLANGQVTA